MEQDPIVTTRPEPAMIRRLPRFGLFPFFLAAFGCSMPEGMNENCDWPAAARTTAERRLVADVRIAEELALRYADARFDSKAGHGRLRSDCETKLFSFLAQGHGVPVAAVDDARRELNADVWDAPVQLPLMVLYVVAALILARKVRRRFPPDEKLPAGLATMFLSVLVAVVFQVLSHMWDGVIEMIRVGNTHMSYRAERLGWRQYSEEVFIVSVLLFWCVVLGFYRVRPHRAKTPALSDRIAGSPTG